MQYKRLSIRFRGGTASLFCTNSTFMSSKSLPDLRQSKKSTQASTGNDSLPSIRSIITRRYLGYIGFLVGPKHKPGNIPREYFISVRFTLGDTLIGSFLKLSVVCNQIHISSTLIQSNADSWNLDWYISHSTELSHDVDQWDSCVKANKNPYSLENQVILICTASG